MSSYSKGLRNKRKAKRYLRSDGFHVADIEDNSKYGETDVFGVADLLAIKKGCTYLVQVKSNRPAAQWKMQEAADKLGLYVECWTWVDYEGFRVQEYVPGYDEIFREYRVDSSVVPT